MSSGLDGPPHRGRCPLKVQRTRALRRRDRVSPARTLLVSSVTPAHGRSLIARFSRGGPGFVATSEGPNGPAPAPLRGDSVSPPWHMATGGRSRRNTTPICTLLNPGVREVRIVILCASRRTSPCRQEAGHRGPHVGSFAQRAPLYERLELTGVCQTEHPMLLSQGHEGCADMCGSRAPAFERRPVGVSVRASGRRRSPSGTLRVPGSRPSTSM